MFTLTRSTNLNTVRQAKESPLAGFSFRHFQNDDDFEAVVAILAARRQVDQVEYVQTLAETRHYYTHAPHFDRFKDVLFAEVGGEPVGYGRVTWWRETSGVLILRHGVYVKPAWRYQGIEDALFAHNEQRLQVIAAEQSHAGAIVYDYFAEESERDTVAMLRQGGYEPERHFYVMVRPSLDNIPDRPLPTGLEVRPVQPDHYQAIWEANLEAFRDHWGFTEEAMDTLADWLASPHFDPSLWRVAWAGDEVAGMVLSFIDQPENDAHGRKRGWTEEICVRRPWRGRGLAKALIALALYAVKERGMTEAALSVDTENTSGALRLYQNMGYQAVRRSAIYRKPYTGPVHERPVPTNGDNHDNQS
jgi:mycothiol synthase